VTNASRGRRESTVTALRVHGAHVAEHGKKVRTKILAPARTLNGGNESLKLVLAQVWFAAFELRQRATSVPRPLWQF